MPDFMELTAKGIKDSGKLVMNSVIDLASSMGTAFTGMTMPEFKAGQLAMAGGAVSNTHTVNMGGLSIVVNGYEAKSVRTLPTPSYSESTRCLARTELCGENELSNSSKSEVFGKPYIILYICQ